MSREIGAGHLTLRFPSLLFLLMGLWQTSVTHDSPLWKCRLVSSRSTYPPFTDRETTAQKGRTTHIRRYSESGIFWGVCLSCLWDSVSLCTSGCPETHCVDQTILELRRLYLLGAESFHYIGFLFFLLKEQITHMPDK